MQPRNNNNNTNNVKLSQWFPNNGYGSNIFPTKVRRTHGWLCPCGDYKSNRWFNTQRHIYKLHGSGEPIDSRTGETKAEKKAGTSTVHHSGSGMFAPNGVIPVMPKELSENRIVYTRAHIPTAELESPRITEDVPSHTTYEDLYSIHFSRRKEEGSWNLGMVSEFLHRASLLLRLK
jgi:hypothetical protein